MTKKLLCMSVIALTFFMVGCNKTDDNVVNVDEDVYSQLPLEDENITTDFSDVANTDNNSQVVDETVVG